MSWLTRRNAQKVALQITDALGAFSVAKLLARKIPRILMYHRFGEHDTARRVGRDTFEAQVKVLTTRFRPISLTRLCASVANGEPLPSDSIVITIDDAYDDFYTYAFPTLERYGVPATIYVPTDFVDGRIWLWPDRIEYVVFRTNYADYSTTLGTNKYTFSLGTPKQRRDTWRTIAGYCFALSEQERSAFIEQVAKDLGVPFPTLLPSEYRPLTWDQLRTVKTQEIDIGSHSCTHDTLVSLERASVVREINESKSRIESMTDDVVHSFAYPFGAETDYNDEIKGLVRDAGYQNAVVSHFDSQMTNDIFALRRSSISADLFEFRKVIFGVRHLSASVRQGFREPT